MKNLLIIVSFIAMIGGTFVSCRGEREPLQYEDVEMEFVKVVPFARMDDNHYVTREWYWYKDHFGGNHYFPTYHGDHYIYPQRR